MEEQQESQPNIPTDSTTHKQTLKKAIVIAAIICFVLLLLFLPIPFRYGKVKCNPIDPDFYCPQEGSIGWHPSIAQQLFSRLFSPSETGQTTPSALPPTPTPTNLYREPAGSETMANWKTYISNNFNYQIKHPNLLENMCNVGGLSPTDKLDIVLSQGQPRQDSEYCGLYTISIFVDETKNSQIQQKIDKFVSYQKEVFSLPDKNYSITNANIGSLQGTKLSITNNPLESSIIYFLLNPNTRKIFYIMVNDNSSKTNSTEIDQILSTFKFTD